MIPQYLPKVPGFLLNDQKLVTKIFQSLQIKKDNWKQVQRLIFQRIKIIIHHLPKSIISLVQRRPQQVFHKRITGSTRNNCWKTKEIKRNLMFLDNQELSMEMKIFKGKESVLDFSIIQICLWEEPFYQRV
jgi:hypothetical protein